MSSSSNNTTTEIFNPNIFSNNRALFSQRFPELSTSLGINSIQDVPRVLKNIPSDYNLAHSSKSDALTLTINATSIHSKYDPIKEATRTLGGTIFQKKDAQQSCIFFGLGLGYLPELYAQKHPHAHIIIIEPDSAVFLCFLASRNLSSFFQHASLSLVIASSPTEAFHFLKASNNINSATYTLQPEKEIYSEWFAEMEALLSRHKQNLQINKNTLKKFEALWLKNLSKNMGFFEELHGVHIFENAFQGTPAIVLAAGPSLTTSLECLTDQHTPALIIATDTALKACLRFGIQPDFVLLFDPQYWNFLHIVRSAAPQSILISDITVYPAVLRQNFRARLLMTSPYPLAQLLETKIDTKGRLETGGSVATTAWDFARFLGASEIIMFGLDLSFPDNQTHFFGSTFEEKAHQKAQRNLPAETASVAALYSAQPEYRPAHSNTDVLTDQRMLLYSWWFEHNVAKKDAPPTTSVLSKGIVINGIENISKEAFATKMERSPTSRTAIKKRLEEILLRPAPHIKQELTSILQNFCTQLNSMHALLTKALTLTETATTAKELTEINTAIQKSTDPALLSAILFHLQESAENFAENTSPVFYRDLLGICTLFLDCLSL